MQPLHRIQLGRAKNLWREATKTGTMPASAHLDMNKQATLHRWDDMPVESVKGGLGRRMITGEQMMITHVYLEKECVVPWHSHENEQITYVLQGSLKFWLGENGEQEIIVHEGEVLLIPSHLPHKAVALEDTLDVDIFCPPRQDWLDGTDAYLR